MKTTDYGFIGVGRMGGHMARRLLAAGHSLTVFDTSKEAIDELAKSGAQAASSALEVANENGVVGQVEKSGLTLECVIGRFGDWEERLAAG